jgi:transposase-like protein
MSEEKCPVCGSTCIIEVSNARHCNQCGKDFAVDRNPIVTRALKAKTDAVGYKPRQVS